MRVLQICADRGIDLTATKGAAVHVRELARALSSLGHDVTTAAARCGSAGHEQPTEPVVTIADMSGLARPDVVHERYSLGHVGGLALARRWRRPFVLEINAPLVEEARRHRPATVGPDDVDAERRLLREADLVLAVSEPLRRWAAAQRGTTTGTEVVANGVAPERFAAAAAIDPATGPPTIAFLGHPKPWHGAGHLVPLLRAVHAAGIDAHLLLIGGGPGAEVVRRAAAAYGLADRVEVTGPLSATEATLRLSTAWLGVAPYDRVDPFYFCPLKVLEYLAAGLPVVTTMQGDLEELVGSSGRLVSADDPDAMVGEVTALLRDPALARELGRAGRRRILDRHSWESVGRSWERLVAPLVDARAVLRTGPAS